VCLNPAVNDAPILEAPFKRAHVEEGEVHTDSSNEMQSSFSQVERVWEMIDCWFDYLVTGRPKQTFISIVLMSSILAILSQMYPNLCCNANDTY
jgi:hypothetical protein